jgi:hypothetical protein
MDEGARRFRARLFATKFGDGLDQRAALLHLKILFRWLKIGGPRMLWHAMRHTFALNYHN